MSNDVAIGSSFGPYQIVKEIGKGGMGEVYLARHTHLERDAALKILSPQIAADQNFVQRFMQEARLAARLNHPNIVHVYDFGCVSDRYYIAMEYVDGPSLGALLRHWGSFPEEQALMLMRQACVALSAAHGAGLIHRDIKPDNFMITKQWQLKLVDLGLARRMDEDLYLTATGFSAGTPHYISPEQVEGRRDLDNRVDIYALGATLYHMLIGKPPFGGGSGAKVMMMHLQADRPDPRAIKPELSPGLTSVLQKMMAIDRERRYRDVYELDRDLYLIQTNQYSSAATPKKSSPQVETDKIVMPLQQPGTRVAPSAPSVSQFPSSESWTSSQLQALEDRLSRFVGPMAKLIVKKAAATATGIPELVQLIAEQIPDATQRKSFLTGVSSSGQLKPPTQPSVVSTGSGTSSASASRSAPTSVSAVVFPADLIDRLEKLLAGHVGPLAKVIVKKAVAKAHSFEGLINQLCAQIPEEKAQRAFRESVRKLSS